MQRNEEPIDVDELFANIQEVEAPLRSSNIALTDTGRKRMKTRMRTHTRLGTSAQPINLISDDEDDLKSKPKPKTNANVNVNAAAGPSGSRGLEGVSMANMENVFGIGPERQTPLDGWARRRAPVSSLSANTNLNASESTQARPNENQPGPSIFPSQPACTDTSGSQTPVGHTRRSFQGLASPIPSPSVSPPTSKCGTYTDPAASAHINIKREVKMDVNSEPSGLFDHPVPDGYSSDEDYWERASDVEMDVDLDDQIDMNAALKAFEKTTERSSSQGPIRSRTLLRAETAILRIPPEIPRPKKRRTWDTYKHNYSTSKYTSLRTDYHRIVLRNGIIPTLNRSQGIFNCRLNVPSPRPNSVFKQTSGSINKIVQSSEFVAVASPTSGGGVDQNMAAGAPEIDPYNKEGNLIVWRGDQNILLDGHSRSWPGGDGNLHGLSKYYSVNDVAFDPLVPNRLVSSGNDCTVRVVDLEICGETFSPKSTFTFTYPSSPYDIAFRPQSSIFATSCLDGRVYIHQGNNRFALEVSDKPDVRPGTFLWGANSANGALRDMLFVSSESERDKVCAHCAFDVHSERLVYELDINESGDSMALDPQGSLLALITSVSDDKQQHGLSLFDVANGDRRRCIGTDLVHRLLPHARSPQLHAPLEVTHSSFSPDGRLLALARNDNTTDVYDIRYLTSDPWAHLPHPFSDPTPNEAERRREAEFFGVTGLHWVNSFSNGLGLVTGAADGCVRLWDVMRAPNHEQESMVLAEIDHDVVCFSVGDPSKNEKKLVVGGYGGEVYFFD